MNIKTCFSLIAFLLMTHSFAHAGEIFTTVFNVIESARTERILLLSGSDGRIYKFPKSPENLEYLKSFQGQVVKLSFYENGDEMILTNIARATTAEADPKVFDLNHFQYNQLRKFAPTDLQSYDQAASLFSSMLNDGDKRRSQCFKRAHMWSFDMWSKLGISSQKIFIFYTQRFIRLEEFEWWFHVAPMVLANGTEYVLDATFFSKPVTLEAWKNRFMRTDKFNCPIVENYNDFKKGQWTRLCYLMKVPMYYFRPSDIEKRDLKKAKKNHWVLPELQDARRAFKNYRDVYEGLDNGKRTITH